MVRLRSLLPLLTLLVHVPRAHAQDGDIFKYTKPDGTVVFTVNLADVPPERRKQYQAQIEAREAKKKEEERTLGKEEVERRALEAERQRVEQSARDAADRAARLKAIDERIAEGSKRREGEDKLKATWQGRMRTAKQRRAQLLAEYLKAQAEYEALAMKAPGTLFPGEAETRDAALERMKKLEPQLDDAMAEVEKRIPEEARKAGIPPGWLR